MSTHYTAEGLGGGLSLGKYRAPPPVPDSPFPAPLLTPVSPASLVGLSWAIGGTWGMFPSQSEVFPLSSQEKQEYKQKLAKEQGALREQLQVSQLERVPHAP